MRSVLSGVIRFVLGTEPFVPAFRLHRCHSSTWHWDICGSFQTTALPFQYLALSHLCQHSDRSFAIPVPGTEPYVQIFIPQCFHSSTWHWAICANTQTAALPFQYLALSHMCQHSDCSVAIPVPGTESFVPAFRLQRCHSSTWHWAICANTQTAVLLFQYLALSHMCQHSDCSVAIPVPGTEPYVPTFRPQCC